MLVEVHIDFEWLIWSNKIVIARNMIEVSYWPDKRKIIYIQVRVQHLL